MPLLMLFRGACAGGEDAMFAACCKDACDGDAATGEDVVEEEVLRRGVRGGDVAAEDEDEDGAPECALVAYDAAEDEDEDENV